jgi:hypothetical protein
MTLPQSDRQISDPETLSNLHPAVSVVLAESRSIASRIMREAGPGETDEQELRRKALFGICDPPNATSPGG